MQKTFAVLTAGLAIICLLCAASAFSKNRRGLGLVFSLNALTNLIYTLQTLMSGHLF